VNELELWEVSHTQLQDLVTIVSVQAVDYIATVRIRIASANSPYF
jgi:hypothetical protein